MKSKRFLGGLALGALIGSALGLFFSPDNGKRNREQFKKTAKKVSEELVKQTAMLKDISKEQYEAVVERIIKKYSKDDLLKKEAWIEIAKELKLRWQDISKSVKEHKDKKD